jgi:hypothetical protein
MSHTHATSDFNHQEDAGYEADYEQWKQACCEEHSISVAWFMKTRVRTKISDCQIACSNLKKQLQGELNLPGCRGSA